MPVEIIKRLARLKKRLETDAAFRQEFEADPDAVFRREIGMSLSELEEHVERLNDDGMKRISGGLTTIGPVFQWLGHFWKS